jgi:HPt (histidine-containing phosphotransfer) domain-containing protein
MTDAVSESSLQAIFAAEAQLHIAQIDASLDALGSCSAAARPALRASLLESLHTLAGAARAVDLDALEWLCRALEGVFKSGGDAAAFDGGQFSRLHEAVDMARALTGRPEARTRNLAMALIARLDAMACQPDAAASASMPPTRSTCP